MQQEFIFIAITKGPTMGTTVEGTASVNQFYLVSFDIMFDPKVAS